MVNDGELLFGYGLVFMVIAAALCQFVMVGLIGLAMFPVAITLLVVAGLRARVPSVHHGRLWLGIFLLFAGIALLVITSTYASTLSFRQARLTNMPVIKDWVFLGFSAFAPPLLMVSSLRLMTDWPGIRCLYWGLGVLGVVPATMLCFKACEIFLPLSA